MLRPPPTCTLFPYTTLFRSSMGRVLARPAIHRPHRPRRGTQLRRVEAGEGEDRKSTRLNSSHVKISYAVFCLKKKKTPGPKPKEEVQPRLWRVKVGVQVIQR